MKRILITGSLIAFMSFSAHLNAQDMDAKGKKDKNKQKETEEIIIRNKGDKDIKLKVEINGDEVIVNGKPLSDFKDSEVTINKRKIIIRDGHHVMGFDLNGNGFHDGMHWNEGGELKAFLGVTTEKADDGAKVTNVTKGSAAEKSGLKTDDIITKVNDKNINDAETLSTVICDQKPKDEVKITYKRNGKENTVKATLGERKLNSAMNYNFRRLAPNVRSFTVPGTPNRDLFGQGNIELQDLARGDGAYNFTPYGSFGRHRKIGLKIQDTEEGGNVKVIEVEERSAAEKAGLKKDDIITEIGGKKVANTDDAREQLKPEEAKSSYTVKALREGKVMSFEIKIPKRLKTASF